MTEKRDELFSVPQFLKRKKCSIENDVCDSGSEGNAAPWTTEEQKLLEQALKTYPVSTPERWEKIAATVPGRSKKDCMKRYKVCQTRTKSYSFIILGVTISNDRSTAYSVKHAESLFSPFVCLIGTGGDG